MKRVVLTKQSAAILETLRAKNDLFNKRILVGISRDQIEQTTKTLRAMKHNLLDGAQEFAAEPSEPGTAKSRENDGTGNARKTRARARTAS